jgi:glucan 1,3-beta-glucosidase
MLVLALVLPMAASYAVARGDRLAGLARALDPSYWRGPDRVEIVLAALLAATMVAAIHVALRLVFDPRHKDFLLPRSPASIALAVLAVAGGNITSGPGRRRSRQPPCW